MELNKLIEEHISWENPKLVVDPSGLNHPAIFSHTRLPVIKKFPKEQQTQIYFASRDVNKIERIYQLDFNINNFEVDYGSLKLVLDYSQELGFFDDNGVCPCCILEINDKSRLYYCGWNLSKKTPFSCAIGVSERQFKNEIFQKLYKGPILERNKFDPIFVAVNDVCFFDGNFHTWYLSCQEWLNDKNSKYSLKHKYSIKYASSKDGINWNTYENFTIKFKNKIEYAISTPRVIKIRNLFFMFYSYRANEKGDFYKIGLAFSRDYLSWQRFDDITLPIFTNESLYPEVACYPCPFIYQKKLNLLFNGNNYGELGIWMTSIELDAFDHIIDFVSKL